MHDIFPWDEPIIMGRYTEGPVQKLVPIYSERDFYLNFEYKGPKKFHGYRVHNILRARRAAFRKEKKAYLEQKDEEDYAARFSDICGGHRLRGKVHSGPIAF